jgi:phosphatidate cytidylyltransferase
MLATRLWMGTILILLTLGMLVLDQHLAPLYPFLLVFQISLALIGCLEIIMLLGPGRRPQILLSFLGLLVLTLANWLAHLPTLGTIHITPWSLLIACFIGLVLLSFLMEMATFVEPERCVERLALTWFILIYLGLLPSFFAQIRWLGGEGKANVVSVALALAIFVPKCCDIGAYFVGRLIGRHPMTPILSPKKTWEGAIGGLTMAVLVTIAVDRLGPIPILQGNLALEIAFALSLGIAGMLGDLAESLIKRDCRKKDASLVVPGFGGVLDVIDAILFAGPVAYAWFAFLI